MHSAAGLLAKGLSSCVLPIGDREVCLSSAAIAFVGCSASSTPSQHGLRALSAAHRISATKSFLRRVPAGGLRDAQIRRLLPYASDYHSASPETEVRRARLGPPGATASLVSRAMLADVPTPSQDRAGSRCRESMNSTIAQ